MLSKTLKEVDEMEASEVELWQYYLSEPRGEDRQDYHAAQICHAIYTILASFSSQDIKLKLEDNLLKFSEIKTEAEAAEEATLKNVAIMQAMFSKSDVGLKLVDKLNSIEKDTESTE
jgi:hypothetical protein